MTVREFISYLNRYDNENLVDVICDIEIEEHNENTCIIVKECYSNYISDFLLDKELHSFYVCGDTLKIVVENEENNKNDDEPEEPEIYSVTFVFDEQGLIDSVNNPGVEEIKLGKDIELYATVVLNEGEKKIDLNGFNVSLHPNVATGAVFLVKEYGTKLTLIDSGGGTGCVDAQRADSNEFINCCVYSTDDAEAVIEGGYYISGKASKKGCSATLRSDSGGKIYVKNGTFTNINDNPKKNPVIFPDSNLFCTGGVFYGDNPEPYIPDNGYKISTLKGSKKIMYKVEKE